MSHADPEDVPRVIKVFTTVTNRVGFPILAAVGMWYLCYVSIERNTKVIVDLKEVIISFKASIDQQNTLTRRRDRRERERDE